MFDWNDEALTNIVWVEADDADDRIVPHREACEVNCKRKQWSQQVDNTEATGANEDINGSGKLESHPIFDLGEGTSTSSAVGMYSWANLSLSNVCKTNRDSSDRSVPKSLNAISRFDSSRGGKRPHLDKGTVIFQNPVEEDFVDYGWASTGSLDDLDCIFSNEDPIFGNISPCNTDEVWSSSKVSNNSSVKSFPLSVGLSTEYSPVNDQLFTPGYGKLNDHASHGKQNALPTLDQADYTGDKSKHVVKEEKIDFILGKHTVADSKLPIENIGVASKSNDMVYKPKKLIRGRKKLEEISDFKIHQDFLSNWSPSGVLGQFKSQFAYPTLHSSLTSILSQHKQQQGPEALYHQQISSPLVATSAYDHPTTTFSTMTVQSHMESGEFQHQAFLPGYDFSSGNSSPANKIADTGNTHAMTPQEKVKKLRRRQKIQAMLAIKKQQQQFVHQISYNDQPPMMQNSFHKDQIQNVQATTDLAVEGLSSVPFNANSPVEQHDSNTSSLAVGDDSTDTLLYNLQDIISKLDVRIRLSIRDSLFRLAQSAVQRHYTSDTSSTNNCGKCEQTVFKADIGGHNGNAEIPEVETETNPIDRAVAYLLFRRTQELSGNPSDPPESPTCIKLPHNHKRGGTVKLPAGCLPNTFRNEQDLCHRGLKSFCSLTDPEPAVGQCRNKFPLDCSENASN